MLVQAGWRPYGLYLNVKPPDRPFMAVKAPNGVGKVYYTMDKNMDSEAAEQVLWFYKERHPESDLTLTSGQTQGAAAPDQAKSDQAARSALLATPADTWPCQPLRLLQDTCPSSTFLMVKSGIHSLERYKS